VAVPPEGARRRAPARLVVLVSGTGTNLQALLDACHDPAYGAAVVAVGSDRDGVPALERARSAGVSTFVVAPGAYPDRDAWDRAIAAAVRAYTPDLVVLAGFMRILGAQFLAAFPDRIVNTHPALLPAFPGAYAVRDALAYGAKVTGVTVHVVDEGVDTGPVIAQAAVPVLASDDEPTLHERIKSVERALLVETVGRMVRDGFEVEGRRVVVR
jgi:phosphoribosylglycinamide formyltransferase 1